MAVFEYAGAAFNTDHISMVGELQTLPNNKGRFYVSVVGVPKRFACVYDSAQHAGREREQLLQMMRPKPR